MKLKLTTISFSALIYTFAPVMFIGATSPVAQIFKQAVKRYYQNLLTFLGEMVGVYTYIKADFAGLLNVAKKIAGLKSANQRYGHTWAERIISALIPVSYV
jgi:hypothetical protein